MSIPRFALFRPIEWTSTATAYSTFEPSGAGFGTARTLDAGVFGMLPALLFQIQDDTDAQITNFEAGIYGSGDNFGLVYFRSDTDTFKIEWTNTDLRDMLGFTGTSSTSSSSGGYNVIVGTYRPKYTWFSSFGTADRSTWKTKPGGNFSGSISQNGRLSGITTGDTLYHWTLSVVMEEDRWVWESLDENQNVVVANADPKDEERSLEYFLRQARQVTPSSGTTVNPRGFYLWYDASTITTTATFTREGIHHVSTSNPDLYAFCSIQTGGWSAPSPAIDRTRERWNLGLPLIKAAPPTWTAPS